MDVLQEVSITPAPLERFIPIIGADRVEQALAEARRLREAAQGRVIWSVSSTAVGGGVAEMLRSLLAYALGAGVSARWLVIRGGAEFFRVTKRLHNALHGEAGDGSPLDAGARAIYERALRTNAAALLSRLHPGDVVLLHDPQTAGLAAELGRRPVHLVWRSHIGTELWNAQTELGWRFLEPYLRHVPALVFSRAQYVPPLLHRARAEIIVPSIDPFSAKNRDMDEAQVRTLLCGAGLLRADRPLPPASFERDDGSSGRLSGLADMVSHGPPPAWEAPLVVQVSRWDDLKDPVGVMRGFGRALPALPASAELLLAGPTVHAVSDDPDGPRVFNALLAAWRELAPPQRRRVHLAMLPMHDVEENAAIVNALQRHAAVVVQKSLREGFGLTVTEAMWKARPVVASAVGGIQDQIVDGQSGLLLRDPTDLGEYARALARVLGDPDLARSLGLNARQRVVERFLGVRHLLQYAAIIERLDAEAHARSGQGASP